MKMKKAFTLMEVMVAVGLLVIIFAFTGIVFHVTVESRRKAVATAEIMTKLRAITNQLDEDFRGLRKDAPFFIWCQVDPNIDFSTYPNYNRDPNVRFDQIMFFTVGDFQSTQLYNWGVSGTDLVPDQSFYDGEILRGSVARVYYGPARSLSRKTGNIQYPWDWTQNQGFLLDPNKRILARNQHILKNNDYILEDWPHPWEIGRYFHLKDDDNPYPTDPNRRYMKNDRYEHDSVTLSQWQAARAEDYTGTPPTIPGVLNICFRTLRVVSMSDPNTYHNLLSQGVSSFAVQWAYHDDKTKELYWYPERDPNRDFHMALLNRSPIGVLFNTPLSQGTVPVPPPAGWDVLEAYKDPARLPYYYYRPDMENTGRLPAALKFTFRLYDSKGVIRDGLEFTHIVYLDN